MACTSVTPDVSKLSGWLNADACCRGTLEAHEEGDTGGGRREGEGVWGRWRCTQRVHGGTDWALGTARVRGAGGRTQNIWLMSVTLDVSKVSGWLNAVASCRVTTRLTGIDR